MAVATGGISFTLTPEQLSAWRLQLPVLRGALLALAPPAAGPAPWICLEFDIPRLGRRVDAVLVTADAVVPIERVVVSGNEESVTVPDAVESGANVRPRGGDLREGAVVVLAGVELTPARIGASQFYCP